MVLSDIVALADPFWVWSRVWAWNEGYGLQHERNHVLERGQLKSAFVQGTWQLGHWPARVHTRTSKREAWSLLRAIADTERRRFLTCTKFLAGRSRSSTLEENTRLTPRLPALSGRDRFVHQVDIRAFIEIYGPSSNQAFIKRWPGHLPNLR